MILDAVLHELDVSTEPVVAKSNALGRIRLAFGLVNEFVELLKLLDYLLKCFVLGNCICVVDGSTDCASQCKAESSYSSHSRVSLN